MKAQSITQHANGFQVRLHNRRITGVKEGDDWTILFISYQGKLTKKEAAAYKKSGFQIYRNCISVMSLKISNESAYGIALGIINTAFTKP